MGTKWVFTIPHGDEADIKYVERRAATKQKLAPRWDEIARKWVYPVILRRRKGEERRVSTAPRYDTSSDPRIRALERREDSLLKGMNLNQKILALATGWAISNRRVGSADRRVRIINSHWARRQGLADRRKS